MSRKISPADSASPSRFPSPRTEPMAAAAWFGAAFRNSNVMYWVGIGEPTCSQVESRKSTSIICAEGRRTAGSGAQPQSNGSARPGRALQPDPFAAQRRRKPGKTAWNSLVCPASAKARRGQPRPQPLRRIDCLHSANRNRSSGAAVLARLAKREGDSRVGMSSGKMRWGIHATAMKPTSSWRSTTNITSAIRDGRWRSHARRLPISSVVRTK